MAQVKNDLGRDAVILHTRRYRKGGLLGFFAKDMVEVMAALDTAVPAAAPEKKVVQPPTVLRSAEDRPEKRHAGGHPATGKLGQVLPGKNKAQFIQLLQSLYGLFLLFLPNPLEPIL